MKTDPVKKALAAMRAYWVSVDDLRDFEKREPNNSGKQWDRRFMAREAAETECRNALKKIPETKAAGKPVDHRPKDLNSKTAKEC